jgi:hypothetical protein
MKKIIDTGKYIDTYKRLYGEHGSFKNYVKNDHIYLQTGWINDNFEVGKYYKSNALDRIAYDYGIIQGEIFCRAVYKSEPKEYYVKHIELMKEYYELKGDTLNEMLKEMKILIKETKNALPKYNN